MLLTDLPNELLQLIAENLESTKHIRNLCLTNRRLYEVINPYLYRHDVERCRSSALHWAAERNNQGVAQKALKAMKCVRVANEYDQSALMVAAKHGSYAVARLLLTVANLSVTDKDGRTALSWAAAEGHEPIVDLLLSKEADMSVEKFDQERPVSLATEKEHARVTELEGVDPNVKDSGGKTPLSLAAENGHKRVVELLLAKEGVDPNCQDFQLQTPLSLAAEKGHVGVVELLIAKEGVDPNHQDTDGWTPVSSAAARGYMRVVELLLKAHANPDLNDIQGGTALYRAVSVESREIVKLLLDANADPDVKYGYLKETPLFVAVYNQNEQIINLLLKAGAALDIQDQRGDTPKSLAVRLEFWSVVDLLEKEIYLYRFKPLLNRRIEDILQIYHRTRDFSHTLKCYRDTFPNNNIRWSVIQKLSRFRILAYALCDYIYKIGKSWGFQTRPYLCLIMTDKHGPHQLVKALEKRSNVRLYASDLNGELMAGSYLKAVTVSEIWEADDSLNGTIWQPQRFLRPLQKGVNTFSEQCERLWLIDIWSGWEYIDLVDVVEQAARECKLEEYEMD